MRASTPLQEMHPNMCQNMGNGDGPVPCDQPLPCANGYRPRREGMVEGMARPRRHSFDQGVSQVDQPVQHPSHEAPFACKPPKPVKRIPERQAVPELRFCGPVMPDEAPMGEPRPPREDMKGGANRPSALCRYRKLPSLGGEELPTRPQTSRESSTRSSKNKLLVLSQQLEEASELAAMCWWSQLTLQMGRQTTALATSRRCGSLMMGKILVLQGWKPQAQPRVATPDLHMLDLTIAPNYQPAPPPPPADDAPADEPSEVTSKRCTSRAKRATAPHPSPEAAPASTKPSAAHIL